MDEDFETYRKPKDGKKKSRRRYRGGDDFPSMATDMIKGINWKIAFFIFILGIFIFSDVFIEMCLVNFTDTIDGDCPTTKGTIIQLLFLVLGYIILDLSVQGEFL